MKRSNLRYWLLVSLIALFSASLAAGAQGFTLINKDQLKEKLGNPDVAIVDVRTPNDWDHSQYKIQGAVRQSPANVKDWMGQYPKDKTIVLYCA